jgi:hypothetical protein
VPCRIPTSATPVTDGNVATYVKRRVQNHDKNDRKTAISWAAYDVPATKTKRDPASVRTPGLFMGIIDLTPWGSGRMGRMLLSPVQAGNSPPLCGSRIPPPT